MRLLIVSNTAHYLREGQIVGWGPTVREINYFANLFEEIRHIAFLHPDKAPESSFPYSSSQISLIPVKPSGGVTLRKKLGGLAIAPHYLSAIHRQLDWADMIHVRCPANISLMAIVILGFLRNPKFRWMKYACNWLPDEKESWAFTFQRWWLKNGFHRGIVTMNGHWAQQPSYVWSLVNPCLTDEELKWASTQAEGKRLSPPFHFLFAGRLESAKGVGRALEIVAELDRRHIPLQLHIAGDGERSSFERVAQRLGLMNRVRFYGWMTRSDLDSLYLRSHFLLFPSDSSEGWPKVLGEAMAFGVIPIAGATSSIPQILASLNIGKALPVHDRGSFVESILRYLDHPDVWYTESKRAILAADSFTYSTYLKELTTLMSKHWRIKLPTYSQPVIAAPDL